MNRLLAALAGSASALALAASAHAEPIEFFFQEDTDYDRQVETPDEAFGHQIGDRPVRMGELNRYLEDLAEGSNRITVEEIGRTHEGRPILFFVVTSEDNHENLDDIRKAHRARLAGEDADEDTPMVLWINYGVHGAESSGLEAAIPTLYHFAAGDSEEIDRTLDESVLLFTVAFNPDGHARRIDHVTTFSSEVPSTDAQDEIHNLWGAARTNHYWFDLNRDWMALTQPESQSWIVKWQEWKPMVTADYHEMGSESPYYFHPGVPARRNPLVSDRGAELTYNIAERHAEALDEYGYLYSTQEAFDNFFTGKGSTYPQVNGSLGILFEAGAARGGQIETSQGLVRHADNVRKHMATALSTIRGSLDQREDIIDFQRGFFEDNLAAAEDDDRRGFVFTAENDPERAARFVRLLHSHDIEVHQLAEDVEANGREYEAETSFVVPLGQRSAQMIRALFDDETEFEENIFYDVSAWTMPRAYNLRYDALGSAFSDDLLGEEADGEVRRARAPARAEYGYVFDWAGTYAPRALYRVLDEDLLVRVTREPYTVQTEDGEREMGRGSVFVPLANQEATEAQIHAVMREIAREDNVEVHALSSGLTPEDGRDLGSFTRSAAVERPNVLIPFDGGISNYDAGEVWWTLDTRFAMPSTLVSKDRLGSIDWSDYTHIVLVGGNSGLDEAGTEQLNDWIEAGGTLVATRQGADWAQDVILDLKDKDEEDGDGGPEGPVRRDMSEYDLTEAEHVIGGAIFSGDLDTSHPLGFGFARRDIALARNTTVVLERPEGNPYAVPIQYADEPLIAGYTSQLRQDELAGTPAMVATRHGRGTVVLMADNPVFRGTWPGTEKLLMNALFFSSMVNNVRTDIPRED